MQANRGFSWLSFAEKKTSTRFLVRSAHAYATFGLFDPHFGWLLGWWKTLRRPEWHIVPQWNNREYRECDGDDEHRCAHGNAQCDAGNPAWGRMRRKALRSRGNVQILLWHCRGARPAIPRLRHSLQTGRKERRLPRRKTLRNDCRWPRRRVSVKSPSLFLHTEIFNALV